MSEVTNVMRMLNITAYALAVGALCLGTVIGVVALWVPDDYKDTAAKGVMSCGILFTAAVIGALITRWLVAR